jgi:methyl-accepting chemotaxis protein
MADFRSDVTKAATEITKVAQDAAYVAIGLGVIGVQKAQVRRQELRSQFERPLEDVRKAVEAPITDFRKELGKAVKEFDKSFGQFIERFDATIEPLSERLPAGAQQVVQQAKEARDQLRGYLVSSLAA